MASRAARTARTRSADPSLPEPVDTNPDTQWHVLVDRLLQKDTIPQPKIFHKSQNITSHLKSVQRYMVAMHINNPQSKVATLINTLDDDVQTELFCQPDFESNEFNYEWVSTTLLGMYQRKATPMSPLIHLLCIKQKIGQKLDDYMTELRVEAYRHWPQERNDKKEEFLVTAFTKGLMNKNLAVAIQAVQPTTLEQAFQLAKKEVKGDQGRQWHENNEKIDIEKQIRVIQQKIMSLLKACKNKLQPSNNK
jgi:hypothetical protein